MTSTLTPVARALLGRLVRSQHPWRASTLPAADVPVLGVLLAAGLVVLAAGMYSPTPAGRLALTS